MPPPSDWEAVGSNPITGMSRIGISMDVSLREYFIFVLHPTRSHCGLFVAACYCCKIRKFTVTACHAYVAVLIVMHGIYLHRVGTLQNVYLS